jgi:hypothetical protein
MPTRSRNWSKNRQKNDAPLKNSLKSARVLGEAINRSAREMRTGGNLRSTQPAPREGSRVDVAGDGFVEPVRANGSQARPSWDSAYDRRPDHAG